MASIYIIAGEASGDFLGAQLIKALRTNDSSIDLKGIGGDLMATHNFSSLFPMQELSLMGIAEIIPHIPRLYRRIKQTVEDIVTQKPDVLVTIDSPGFCHRVAKAVKKKLPSIKIVHYVAPSVWAWRQGRAKKLGRWVDHLLTLFPFEPQYFLPHGLATTFVGHPLLEQNIHPDLIFRKRYNISEDLKVLTLLAGSRKGELEKLLPLFCQVVQNFPHIHIVAPTLPIFAETVRQELLKTGLSFTVTTSPQDKYAAFYASDAALAASGTVALELALTGLPMVIGYKVSPLTYFLAKFLIKVKHVCLVNILLNKGVVEEYLQAECTVDNLTVALNRLLTEQGQQQKPHLKQAVNLLKSPEGTSPSQKAAEVILSLV